MPCAACRLFGAVERGCGFPEKGSVLIRGFFKGVAAMALACIVVVVGVNAWIVLSSKADIETLDSAVSCEAP